MPNLPNEQAPALVHVCTFLHLDTRQWHDTSGYGAWHRVDQFYCQHCCEFKVVHRTEHAFSPVRTALGRPDWFTL